MDTVCVNPSVRWNVLDDFTGSNLRVNKRCQITSETRAVDDVLANDISVDPRLWMDHAQHLQQLEISELPFHVFPCELSYLTKLRQLTISDTLIEYLPPDLFCHSHEVLEFLSLSGNRLKQLPPSIILCSKLSTLNVSCNDISNDSLKCLADLSSLSILNISSNFAVSKLPNDLITLAELQARSCSLVLPPRGWLGLKIAILADNALTSVDELSACEKLKVVDLSNNPLVDKSLRKASEKCEGGSKEILKHLRGGNSKRKVKQDRIVQKNQDEINAPLPKRMKVSGDQTVDLKIDISRAARAKRPYMYAAVLHFPANLTLDENGLRSFLDVQNKLHSKECQKRTLAGIASHDCSAVNWPLILDVADVCDSDSTGSRNIFHALALQDRGPLPVREIIELLKNDTSVAKYTKEISSSKQFVFLADRGGDIISLYPVSNCAKTKNSPGMRQVLVEVSSCMDASVAKHVFMETIRAAIDIAEATSPRADDEHEIVTVQQVCVDGTIIPSREDIGLL